MQEQETTAPVAVRTFPVVETNPPLSLETEAVPAETETPQPSTWQDFYRVYLEKVRDEQPELKFTLLCIDEDDIPELCFYQDTCVDVYSYKDDTISYAFRFQTGYYSYDFSYRPHQCMIASQQGSVMGDGTYTFIEVFERTDEGFIHSGKYGFSDTPHTIESLKEQGYYTDDEEILESLDIVQDEEFSLGESWISYHDYDQSGVTLYEMTDENFDLLLNEE
ncbi:MAG TPA: hypothetical protein DCO72_09755 [Ruminococcus sp.]|jgi:hypothetical protein|nr:hypothetical protein [Ruminococcus sp.]